MLEHEYNDDLADEVLEDVEIYDGDPDFDCSQTDEAGGQDDGEIFQGMSLMARATNAIRTWSEALAWYKTNRTKEQIGFDPDGMCLKVCRTARGIPAKYLTAKEAQDATPIEHRVTRVRDLRRGMVVFFDDPVDSNKSGHIATVQGRVKGFDPDDLNDVLTKTNSVKSDELVTVRGGYYSRVWGDEYVFGATWLNGVELDVPGRASKVERFNDGGPVYNLNLLAKAGKDRPKPAAILDRIETQIKRLPDNPKLVRVREFKNEWRSDRKIDLSLLDAAVREGRVGVVKQVRDEIKRLIQTLPDE